MTGLFRILLFVLLGYVLIKAFNFIKSIISSSNEINEEKIKGNHNQQNKIDKKDVIDAQFEEIEVKDKNTSKS